MTTNSSSHAPAPQVHEDRKIAVFIDMDNVVLGARDAKFQKFEVGLILDRLVEKGDIVVKRAYDN